MRDREFIQQVVGLYQSGMPSRRVGKALGVSKDIVLRTLEDEGIARRTRSEFSKTRRNSITPSNRLREIVDGLLLSDGSISPKNEFVFANTKRGFIEYVADALTCEGIEIRRYEYPAAFRLESRVYDWFWDERRRWYRPKKVVPQDIILTPMVALMWFLGDGQLTKVKSRGSDWITYGVILHTQGFCNNDQQRLVELLHTCGISAKVRADRVYQTIVIGADGYEAFFAYIGNCPLIDFAYKWPPPQERPILTRRQQEALELRRRGLGVRRMGREMGITPVAAWVLLSYLRKKLPDEPALHNFDPGPR